MKPVLAAAPESTEAPETESEPERRLTGLFHRVNSFLPGSQEVVSVAPGTKVVDALKLMRERGFSQLPVVVGKEVLGVFTFRKFALGVMELPERERARVDHTVDDFLEELCFVRVTDEIEGTFTRLDADNAVLVGDPNRLQGILTPMDALRYLYGVASAFVVLQEIELALRELISLCTSAEELAASIRTCLMSLYKDREAAIPQRLEEMSFSEYVSVICHGSTWAAKFQVAFGGSRERAHAKLKGVADLRNDVFHFKRALTPSDHETLRTCRQWLLTRVRFNEAKRAGAGND